MGGKPTTTKNSGCKSAKECGNTNNNKKPVCRDFDFDPKKSVRKTKEIPRIRHRSACKFPTKKCGKITNKKVCRVLDFENKKKCEKNQRNTEDPPQICLQIYGQKVRKNPKIKRLITFFPQILLFWPVGRPRVVSVCSAVDSDPRAVRCRRYRPPNMDDHSFGQFWYKITNFTLGTH